MKSDRSIRRGLHETRRGISSCPNEFLSSVEKPRGPRLVFRLFLLPVSQTRPKLSANHAGFYRFAQQHTAATKQQGWQAFNALAAERISVFYP